MNALQYIKDSALGFYVLVVAFSYSIFFIVQVGFGLPVEGLLFKNYSAIVSISALVFYLYNCKELPRKVNEYTILSIVLIISLFYVTQIIYGYVHKEYLSNFLAMGVRFVPAVLVGAAILKYDDILEKIEYGIFPFVILYTIILAKTVFSAKLGVNLNETFDFVGLSYQSISYYSIFAFGLTLYLVTTENVPVILRRILVAAAFIQFVMSIMAGGRGALVLGVFFTLYFGLKKISFQQIVVYLLFAWILITVIVPILAENDLFQLGFNRLSNFFGSGNTIANDIRWIRWHKALDVFYANTFIGTGIGSVFYEVGFYSHNIFTDILCEGGITLMIVFLIILYKYFSDVIFLISISRKYEIMVVIFLCSFIMCWFSGYYLSESAIWLSITFVLGKYYIINNDELLS